MSLIPVIPRSVSRWMTRGLFTQSSFQAPVKPGSSSEATVPGGGSTEDVAHSSGAFSKESNPNKSSSQIQQEKGDQVNMQHSAATSEASKLATKGGQAGPGSKSKRDEGVSKELPPSDGKSEDN